MSINVNSIDNQSVRFSLPPGSNNLNELDLYLDLSMNISAINYNRYDLMIDFLDLKAFIDVNQTAIDNSRTVSCGFLDMMFGLVELAASLTFFCYSFSYFFHTSLYLLISKIWWAVHLQILIKTINPPYFLSLEQATTPNCTFPHGVNRCFSKWTFICITIPIQKWGSCETRLLQKF